MFKYHQLAVTTIGTPVGCPHCHQSGYQGRMAIHENDGGDAGIAGRYS